MADTRTLKLALLADVQKFLSGMNEAETGAKGLNSKINKYSKAMAKSFAIAGAAAGAYAIKIGMDSVNAAIEDEKSQATLAQALKNTTDATSANIAETEKYISKTQLRYGVSDVKLRASLGDLLRATGDVTKAQSLNNLALDISIATGKDLETVALSLGKAYNGNFGALTKLGIPLDDAIKKSGDFNVVQAELTKLFGGAAAANTETYAGKLAIVKERFDEMKEAAGARLLPVLSVLLENINMTAKAIGGEDPQGLSQRARELAGIYDGKNGSSYNLGLALKNVADAFGNLFGTITGDGPGATTAIQTFADALNSVAHSIDTIQAAYAKAKDALSFLEPVNNVIKSFIGPQRLLGPQQLPKKRALGGPVSGGQSYLVGERGPEMFTPTIGGRITPNGGGGGQTIININGVIDAESARRSIEKLLQNSARRTGPINLVGATL